MKLAAQEYVYVLDSVETKYHTGQPNGNRFSMGTPAFLSEKLNTLNDRTFDACDRNKRIWRGIRGRSNDTYSHPAMCAQIRSNYAQSPQISHMYVTFDSRR